MPYVVGDVDLSLAYLDFEVGLAPQSTAIRCRGRVIFPIRDEEGVLKGFAVQGRFLPDHPERSI